jgi:hypothetical protein
VKGKIGVVCRLKALCPGKSEVKGKLGVVRRLDAFCPGKRLNER